MTIGVGFKCTDGIVIAADTQYTRGAFKSNGPKLFHLEQPGVAVVIAGAGHVAFMKRAFEKLATALTLRPNPNCNDVRDCIEDTLHGFFHRHIYPIPGYTPDSFGFDLIVGVWSTVDGYKLFKTSETAVVEIAPSSHGCCTIGYGFPVADHALDLTYPRVGINVENAKFVAALSVKAAKEHSDFCGGKTHIWTLQDNRSGYYAHPVLPIDVTDAQQYSEDLFDIVRDIIECLDPESLLDAEAIGFLTDYLRDNIIKFRTKQIERREKTRKSRENAAKMAASLEAARKRAAAKRPEP